MSWLNGLVADCLVGSPSEGVCEWSCKNVFLGGKETPTPEFYDVRKTPWNKRMMDCATDPEVKKVVMMKSSRSGATEACLNVLRWMPDHKPGPALYAINSEKKGREVAERRLIPHYLKLAQDHLTGDPDDVSKLLIKLRNMDVTVSGSGSPAAFMEGWYSVIVLDEYEEHQGEHEETTADRAEGRQTTVDDPTLYILSKPQLEGGPIELEYLRGSQEKFHVPCPRCGERQELVWEFMRFNHCRDLGGWDMERVLEDTFYECRHCGGRIDDWEKFEMNQAGVYVPEKEADRKGVKQEIGTVSLHISDLYVPHPQTKWGMLAQKFLNAFVINPDEGKKKWVWTNHFAKTWELRKAQMRMKDLDALKGGIVEEDDSGRRIVRGKKFRWCHDKDGEMVEKLPIVPKLITICADKQGDCLKYVVFAWGRRWNAWAIDYGMCYDEQYLIDLLDRRVYIDKKGGTHKMVGGLIDSRYKPKTVFRACVASNNRFHPSMGHGETDLFAGKMLKVRDDVIDGTPIRIYDYHNHTLESDFYLGKVKRREEPRLWLPENMGDEFGQELCSAKLVVKGKREKWDKNPDVPNDWGDACKMQYLLREITLIEVGDVCAV